MSEQSESYGLYVGGERKGSETFSPEQVDALLSDAKGDRPDARDVDDTEQVVLTSTDRVEYMVQFKPVNEQ